MNSFINNWAEGIIVAVIIVTLIEIIAPKGKIKKYLDVVFGLYIVFTIVSPIIYQLNGRKLEKVFDIDEFEYEIIESRNEENINNDSYSNFSSNSAKTIRELYISNLESDINNYLKIKGYDAERISIKVKNDDNFTIEKIEVCIDKSKEKVSNEKKDKKIQIDDIVISKFKNIETEKALSKQETSNIQKLISDKYDIDSKLIFVE